MLSESAYEQFMSSFDKSLDFLKVFEECFRHAVTEAERMEVLDALIADSTVKIVSGLEHLGGNVHKEVGSLVSTAVQRATSNGKLQLSALKAELLAIANATAQVANSQVQTKTTLDPRLDKLENEIKNFQTKVITETAKLKADEKYRYVQQILAELDELLGDEHVDYASLSARFAEIKDRYKPLT